MPTKRANNDGSVRKIRRTYKGKTRYYWEARYTTGKDPGDNSQIQKSKTFGTQAEAAAFLREVTHHIDTGEYTEPSKLTVGVWLDIWLRDYLIGKADRTVEDYKRNVKLYIKPLIGAIKLTALTAADVQHLYNSITKEDGSELSPKTIRNVHGTLHKALSQAKKLGYIRVNVADEPNLPKVEKKPLRVFETDEEMAVFLKHLEGHKYGIFFKVLLFTGMRESELIGLTWEDIDFKKGLITIQHQLQRKREKDAPYKLIPPKRDKIRVIAPSQYVMDLLKEQQLHQFRMRNEAGSLWNNEFNLVFTDETGNNYCVQTVSYRFKKLIRQLGMDDMRLHDLRHSYAVTSLRSGNNPKNVSDDLGHYSTAFTLDTYAQVTAAMQKESANRMDAFIKSLPEVKTS